jgi:DNA-binding MarR family transcriptional regulator
VPSELLCVNMSHMHDSEDQPLGYLLYGAAAAMRPHVTTELRPLGLGLPEFVCLRNLSMAPDQSSAELARRANVSPQAMNLLLRGLQEIGAVTRPASVSSGRALPARLTAKGKALLKRAEKAVHIADERLLTQLTPTERRELKRLLHALDGTDPSGVSPDIADETA